MWRRVGDSLGALLELVLPRWCAACHHRDQHAEPLCPSCAETFLNMVAQRHCVRCGVTVAEGLPVEEDGCVHCPTPMPRFDRLVRLAGYQPPMTWIIRHYKFHGDHSANRWLADLLASKIQATPPLDSLDVVQAVPLHWQRRLWRGYNQAAVLAEALARRLDLPHARELARIRNTREQARLPRTQRAANVKGAFAVGRSRTIAGRHVLLVDDVTTTGATASEATRALLAGGAARVSLAVLAKADPPPAFAPRHG